MNLSRFKSFFTLYISSVSLSFPSKGPFILLKLWTKFWTLLCKFNKSFSKFIKDDLIVFIVSVAETNFL